MQQIAALLYGVKPVLVVVIAQGSLRRSKSAVKSAGLALLGVLAMVAAANSNDNGEKMLACAILA